MKKKILVTGSSRGIGLSIALKLLKEGNEVVINGRRKEILSKICKKTWDSNMLLEILATLLMQKIIF